MDDFNTGAYHTYTNDNVLKSSASLSENEGFGPYEVNGNNDFKPLIAIQGELTSDWYYKGIISPDYMYYYWFQDGYGVNVEGYTSDLPPRDFSLGNPPLKAVYLSDGNQNIVTESNFESGSYSFANNNLIIYNKIFQLIFDDFERTQLAMMKLIMNQGVDCFSENSLSNSEKKYCDFMNGNFDAVPAGDYKINVGYKLPYGDIPPISYKLIQHKN
jgi:hypothetical protein